MQPPKGTKNLTEEKNGIHCACKRIKSSGQGDVQDTDSRPTVIPEPFDCRKVRELSDQLIR